MKILLGMLVIDRPRTTEKCIQQILKNTDRSKFTWIAIDNNSNEETKEVLWRHKDDLDLVIHNDFNVGTAFGVNQYLAYRDPGQHVLNANVDAHILTDDWLSTMLYVEKEIEDLGTISGRRPTFWYDYQERWDFYRQHVSIQGLNNNLLFIEHPDNNQIIFPWTMILSRTIEQIGYMNEETCVDDIDYIERISAIKLRNVYVPDVVILQPQDEEQHHKEYKANRNLIETHWGEHWLNVKGYREGTKKVWCGNRFMLMERGPKEYQQASDANWEFFKTYQSKELFRCMKCSKEFKEKPGPTECPYCGNLYVEWVSFDTFKEREDADKRGSTKED